MKMITTEKTITSTRYETRDGQQFIRQDEAELHEKYLFYKDKVDQLRCINGAYYCETQEDFDAIVHSEAYQHPYDSAGLDGYRISYEYNTTDFTGPDWYFFHKEYDRGDDEFTYWVESLSQMKEEWDEFYEQYS